MNTTLSEKKRILEMHYNAKNNQNLFEQQNNSVDRCCQPAATGEIINKNHDDVWDYKKVGDKYYARKKCTKWVEATGTARESIKNNVFVDKQQNPADSGSYMETMPKISNSIYQADSTEKIPKLDNYQMQRDNTSVGGFQ